jgi:Na+/H+ antiporter NhaD/arsenite permease-like protein
MHAEDERISIWFFIGLIVFVYGLLITGAGVYELFVPPARPVVLASLHAGIWWGALLVILGAFYLYRFAPKKEK